jgi:hypothetical protein
LVCGCRVLDRLTSDIPAPLLRSCHFLLLERNTTTHHHYNWSAKIITLFRLRKKKNPLPASITNKTGR